MADTIVRSDRALIDAALARGKAQHIPRGVGGIDESKSLTPAEWMGLQWLKKPGARVPPEVARRRGVVRDLHERGFKTAQIAERVEVDARTVRNDLAALRADGRVEGRR